MKIKSYTFHYYDKNGERARKTYVVDGVMIRHDQDAKNLFYRTVSIKDVIFLTANY